jgi:hypothetical protein
MATWEAVGTVRCRLRALATLTICGMALVPLEFLSAGTSRGAANVETVANTSVLQSTACWTQSNCVAVGRLKPNPASIPVPVVVAITNGVAGAAQVLSTLSGEALNGVACEPTTTTCIAVGPGSPGADSPLIVPITDGSAGSPESPPGVGALLSGITCTSASECTAVGSVGGNTGSSFPGIVLPITNGTPGTPEYVSDGSVGGQVFLDNIACLSSTDCVATGSDQEGSVVGQDVGADVAVVNGTPGSLVLDHSLDLIMDGSCPTSTSCLFSASQAYTNDLAVVSVDGNGNPGTPQPVPEGGAFVGYADVVCPSSTTRCALVGGTTANMGVIVPVNNGVPGQPVAVQGTSLLQSITCPTASSCLTSGLLQSNGVTQGVAVPLIPPSTSVIIPSNGAILSGSALLDAAGSDNIGVIEVQFEVSGGPSNLNEQVVATASPSLYGWLANWNTTTVPNGTYSLQSVATDTEGLVTTSAPITVSVNNAAPMTSVLIPSNNASVSGTQLLDAAATSGVAQVQFEVSGGPSNLNDQIVATANLTLYGWLANWNTTNLPNGMYTLQSVASYFAGGPSGTSAGITVTVNNAPPTTSVVLPAGGATLSASVWLDASASTGVTQVVYTLAGGTLNGVVIATATPTAYGWLAARNTASVPDGTYTLRSMASYAGGLSSTSPSIAVTVAN